MGIELGHLIGSTWDGFRILAIRRDPAEPRFFVDLGLTEVEPEHWNTVVRSMTLGELIDEVVPDQTIRIGPRPVLPPGLLPEDDK